MTDSAPAGWYPDGRGGHRYWDGSGWLAPGHGPVAPRPVLPPPPSAPPPSGPPPSGPPPSGPPPSSRPLRPPPGGPPRQTTGRPGGAGSRRGRIALVAVPALVLVAVGVTAFATPGFLVDEDSSQGAGTDEPDVLDPNTEEPTEVEPGDPDPFGGGGGGATGDPGETVETFYAALTSGRCAQAVEHVVAADRGGFTRLCEQVSDSGLDQIEYEVSDTEVDGDTASVTLTSTVEVEGLDPITSEEDVELVVEDGEWRISNLLGAGMKPDDIPSFDPNDQPPLDPDDRS